MSSTAERIGWGMFRTGAIALAAMLLIAAAPIPPSNPADQRRPSVTEQQSESHNEVQHNKANTAQDSGSAASHPLYVRAACEHGCGYAESDKGWWQKLWTDPIATFSAVLALLTFGLIGVGIVQGILINRQINLARDDFEATHRPWLNVQIAIGPRGLYFDVNGANLDLVAICKNATNSPAKDVGFHIRPIFLGKYQPGAKGQERVLNAQATLCDEIRKQPYHPWADGRVVFPNDQFVENMIYSFCGAQELDRMSKEEVPVAGWLPSLVIVGCVDYRFPFGGSAHHQTGFAYSIQRLKPGHPGVFGFEYPSVDLPPAQLLLNPWHQGAAFYAD